MAPIPTGQPSYLRGLWYRWKSLRLPWRSTFLVGHDLAGNTFWEFRNKLNPNRARRVAKYPASTHYGDVNLTPAWLQWLRHTRADAPTLEEQQYEVVRQENLKALAARADERWAQKESYLDSPQQYGQPAPLMEPRDRGAYTGQTGGTESAAAAEQERPAKGTASPWAKWEKEKRGGPSEGWQPDAWTPGKPDGR